MPTADTLSPPTPTRQKAIVEAHGISKQFGELEVLTNIDFSLAPSEVVCVIGPSGSGKSTLLRCLAFLEPYDHGSVYIDGQLLGFEDRNGKRVRTSEKRVDEVRAPVGMVFQHFHLWPHRTALENVTEALRLVNGLSRQDAEVEGMAMLEQVGLADRAGHFPESVSGGQKQRVAIARALVNDPEIILADEPTGNLDSENSRILMNMIQELVHDEGRSFLIVTHSETIAENCDRKFLLPSGELNVM